MLNIPAGWKLVPIEPTETMVVCGFESRPDPFFSKPEDWEAFDAMTGCQQTAHKARLCYAAMLDAAPTPPSVAPGDAQDEDDSIALDKLADYIADTWPDKKYGLEEICQRLHAMWPGEFLSAADLEKNDPNVREALRALLLWWDRFQASDGDPKDACELLVKDARFAWQFAEAEINRAPATAPAAGDALPTIKGAAITGGYVVVTPAGWGEDKPQKVRDAILRLFPVNPAYTPKPETDLAAQQGKGGEA